MYCVSWSDDTGEHKKDKKKKRPIGKVQVGGVGPQAPHHISRLSLSLAGCTWLSGKQTKAKPSSASYSPVSFYTFLFILQSYLCTSNYPQSTKFPSFFMCKNSSLSIWALASISPSGSTGASELLYLCLRCLCHRRVSYSFFCLFTSFYYSFEEFVPVSESIVWNGRNS
jgi:hypothetical protein